MNGKKKIKERLRRKMVEARKEIKFSNIKERYKKEAQKC